MIYVFSKFLQKSNIMEITKFNLMSYYDLVMLPVASASINGKHSLSSPEDSNSNLWKCFLSLTFQLKVANGPAWYVYKIFE